MCRETDRLMQLVAITRINPFAKGAQLIKQNRGQARCLANLLDQPTFHMEENFDLVLFVSRALRRERKRSSIRPLYDLGDMRCWTLVIRRSYRERSGKTTFWAITLYCLVGAQQAGNV